MIPRNKRKIDSHKIARILCLIEKNLAEAWKGNIDNQNKFTKLLEKNKIKKKGDQYDKNSGGARTYLSQLEYLGLVFVKNKNYYLSIAGETILEGIEPKKIIQHNLLNLQYPSSYSKSKQCNLNPDIKIKPFLLIMNILEDKEIRYLTSHEIILISIFGHNFNCTESCKDKIKQLREYEESFEGLIEILTPFKKLMISARTSKRTIKELIMNHNDNANTFGNYLQATDLVVEGNKVKNKKTIILNEEYLKVYHDYLSVKNKFIKFNDDEQFQRNFGKYHSSKDTRTIEKIKKIKGEIPKKNTIIKKHYFDTKSYEDASLNSFNKKFYDDLYQQYGFKKNEINEIIEPLIQKNFEEIFNQIIKISMSGKKYALQFEKDLATIFENYWGFFSHLTGQKKRYKAGGGAYSDIFLVTKDKKTCSLIDAKAIKNYALPNDDRLKMINSYAKNYKELESEFNYKDLKLDFILYVTGSINNRSDIKKNCEYMSKEINNIPISVISSHDFVSLAKKYKGHNYQNEIRKIFCKSGVL